MPDPFQYDVFLSHNQANKPRVRRPAERLRAAGGDLPLDLQLSTLNRFSGWTAAPLGGATCPFAIQPTPVVASSRFGTQD